MILLANSPLVDNYDLSCVQTIICSTAPLSASTEAVVLKRTGIKNIRQTYGLTETSGVLIQTDTHHKSGSVGTLRDGVWGKVVDTDSGRLLGPNESGELVFKGRCAMKGYVNNPEATRDTIDADGWIRTGDIGYYDTDHEWFIVDRIKELIKYKGHQVPPAELESLLLTHPQVLDAGVIGIPDEKAGELPLAFVVRSGNVSEMEICDFIADRVSHVKRLHGGVRFIDAIPRNPTGKILRRLLREQAKLKAKL